MHESGEFYHSKDIWVNFWVVSIVIQAILTDASGISGIHKYALPKPNCMKSLPCVENSSCFPISSKRK